MPNEPEAVERGRRPCRGGRGRGVRAGGLLEPALLAALAARPSHGYDLRRAVEELSGGLVCMDPGGMYRVLRRLEEESYIVSKWSTGEHGPQRREYELTDQGRSLLRQWAEHLRERERVFRSVIELVDRSLGPVPVIEPTGSGSGKASKRGGI
ncbi:MAG TPA: PadR family transcriptional regulator [Gaiellaceae bacterium]